MKFVAMLAFYPNQKNPARESGRGVYRVMACSVPSASLATPRVTRFLPGRKLLVLAVTRMLKVGSRVDPVRLALARLQATT